MKNKEQQILKLLKKGKMSTTKIASEIKASYIRALQLLNKSEKKKKIKQNKELMGVSWSLK